MIDLIPNPNGHKDGARPRWECPNCGSTNVQIALPAWYRETANGLSFVDADEEADALYWCCDDCDHAGEGRPIDRFNGEVAV